MFTLRKYLKTHVLNVKSRKVCIFIFVLFTSVYIYIYICINTMIAANLQSNIYSYIYIYTFCFSPFSSMTTTSVITASQISPCNFKSAHCDFLTLLAINVLQNQLALVALEVRAEEGAQQGVGDEPIRNQKTTTKHSFHASFALLSQRRPLHL